MSSNDTAGLELLSPAQRLEATRARLRKSWLREETDEEASQRAAEDDSLIHRFTDLVTNGWKHHPLKHSIDAASAVAGPALRAALGPVARSHPLRLVALAGGLGIVIMWVRPWRLVSRAALSSVLISAVIPRRAIARWWASGQWLDLLQGDRVQSWFAARQVPPESSSSSDPPSDAEAPASYVKRASSPISTSHPAS